jgi:hypothetical protein
MHQPRDSSRRCARPLLAPQEAAEDAGYPESQNGAEADGSHDNPPNPGRKTVHGVGSPIRCKSILPTYTKQIHITDVMVNADQDPFPDLTSTRPRAVRSALRWRSSFAAMPSIVSCRPRIPKKIAAVSEADRNFSCLSLSDRVFPVPGRCRASAPSRAVCFRPRARSLRCQGSAARP